MPDERAGQARGGARSIAGPGVVLEPWLRARAAGRGMPVRRPHTRRRRCGSARDDRDARRRRLRRCRTSSASTAPASVPPSTLLPEGCVASMSALVMSDPPSYWVGEVIARGPCSLSALQRWREAVYPGAQSSERVRACGVRRSETPARRSPRFRTRSLQCTRSTSQCRSSFEDGRRPPVIACAVAAAWLLLAVLAAAPVARCSHRRLPRQPVSGRAPPSNLRDGIRTAKSHARSARMRR